MSTHDPDGQLLCIHSVCVAEEHRGKGHGSKLMTAYINYVQSTRPDLKSIRLLCKEYLVSLFGFLLFTKCLSYK